MVSGCLRWAVALCSHLKRTVELILCFMTLNNFNCFSLWAVPVAFIDTVSEVCSVDMAGFRATTVTVEVPVTLVRDTPIWMSYFGFFM